MPQICDTFSTTAFSLCPNCRQHSWSILSRYSSSSLESCRSSGTKCIWFYNRLASECCFIPMFTPIYPTRKRLPTPLRSQIPRKSPSPLDLRFWRGDNSNHWPDIQPDLFSRLSQMVRNYLSQLVTNFTSFRRVLAKSVFISRFEFQSEWSNTTQSKLTTNLNIFGYVHQSKWFSGPGWLGQFKQQTCFSSTTPS